MDQTSSKSSRTSSDTNDTPYVAKETRQNLLRSLCFFTDPPNGEPPEYDTPDESLPGKRNYPHHRVVVPISDARGAEHSFSLHRNAFFLHPKAFDAERMIDFNDKSDVENNYLPWIERFISKTLPGTKKVFMWNFTVRKASEAKVANRQVNKLHVDQSIDGAYRRARRHLSPAEVDAIVTGASRLRIINVWKPISKVVVDHPLVFADQRSIKQDDLVAVRQVYPDYVGETYVLRHRDGQQFWYWSGMGCEDIVLLQCFDSKSVNNSEDGLKHTQCVHGSFEPDDSGKERFDRESIEVRCLVID